MADDPVPQPVESPQTPVSDGLANVLIPEPVSEPTSEASASAPSEPAQPVSDAAEVAAEPQSEPPTPEAKPQTQSATSAASAPSLISDKTPEHDRELLKIARAKIQTKKSEKLEKIMMLFEKKKEVTNDDVEKLLRCSDATARRYLNELVKQGKLKRVGETGAGVAYIKA